MLPNAIVEYLGYITHYNAIALMKSADLLLNFVVKGAEHQMISGKLLENLTVAHISLGGFPAFTCSGTFSQSLGESASNQTGLVFPKTLLTVPRYPLIHKRYYQLRIIGVHVL